MTKKSSASKLMSSILSGAVDKKPDDNLESKQSILTHRSQRAHADIQPTKSKSKTKVITTLWVDVKKCSIQKRPNRFYNLLTEENCADLISSIECQGQTMPAIARQTESKEKPYEIIVGRRRHFSATILNNELLIDVRVLSDEEAFLLSEAENEGRKDLSDLEKAYDWADALKTFYNDNVARLATAVNKPRQTIYQFLDLAKLGKEILDAYQSPLDVKVRHAAKLKTLMKDPASKQRILQKASELSESKKLDGAAVYNALVTASKNKPKNNKSLNQDIHNKAGDTLFNLSKTSAGKLVVKFKANDYQNTEELMKLLEDSLIKHL